jgi:hypothetical protein
MQVTHSVNMGVDCCNTIALPSILFGNVEQSVSPGGHAWLQLKTRQHATLHLRRPASLVGVSSFNPSSCLVQHLDV